MAVKVLGQAIPAAATLTGLYTVPGATTAVVSTLYACNQGSSVAKIRVSVAVAGAADATYQYIAFDQPIPAGRTWRETTGITLGATDVLRVQSDTGLVSFNAFGDAS